MAELTQEEKLDAEVDRVLSEVLELFRATHWTQGTYHRYDYVKEKNLYCAVGGILHATRGPSNPAYWPAVERVASVIHPDLSYTMGKAESQIVSWNDSGERSLPDVLNVFEQAIELRQKQPLWRRIVRRLRSFL